MFAKRPKTKHPVIADKIEISIIFNRMLERNQSIHLKFAEDRVMCRVLAIEGDYVFLASSQQDRDKYNITPNQAIAFVFYHEGKEYYASSSLNGSGKMEGRDALRMAMPTNVKINDDYCLTQLNLTPKKSITFTSSMNQICDGDLINIGVKGVDFRSKGPSNQELLTIDQQTMVAFDLEPGFSIAQKGRVLYFNDFGQSVVGVEFADMPPDVEKRLGRWLQEMLEQKSAAEKSWLQKGGARSRKTDKSAVEAPKTLADLEDFETVIKDGTAYVLVITREEQMLERLTKSLARKYGILACKGRFKRVEQIISKYTPSLIIIHDQLGTVSGYDLTRTILKHVEGGYRVMIMGSEEERVEKQALSHEAGALDFLVVEPFHMLRVFRMIDDAV